MIMNLLCEKNGRLGAGLSGAYHVVCVRHALFTGGTHHHPVLAFFLAVLAHVLAQHACATAIGTVDHLKLTRRAQMILQARKAVTSARIIKLLGCNVVHDYVHVVHSFVHLMT